MLENTRVAPRHRRFGDCVWGERAKTLEGADQAAAFTEAGFKKRGRTWRNCDDPGRGTYAPGSIDRVADLNGDGHPDAVLVEAIASATARRERGFWRVRKRSDVSWRLMTGGPGIVELLKTKAWMAGPT